MSKIAANTLVAFVFLFSSDAGAQAPPSAGIAHNDYGRPEAWLCRPGRKDACAVDLSTTVVRADGKLIREPFRSDARAPIDCFYVYPTVSLDETPNSDMSAGPEERTVVQHQFARFAAKCRVYAPVYRQVTLTALRAILTGKVVPIDRALGYGDVLDAWNLYLEHDNKGRGVVLIGHSQGANVLTELIKNEIDGKPVQQRLVSALLLGTNFAVPEGQNVGGTFKHVPLCNSSAQTGCVVTYVSFRQTAPPSQTSLFGRVQGAAMQAACTNPAALGGGSATLHAYLPTGRSFTSAAAAPRPWVMPEQKIETPFVSVPGLLSAQCVSNGAGSYLSVKVNGDPNDPRTDDIAGDIIANDQVLKDWGLHLIDVNLAMGDLVGIVGAQAATYRRKN